MTVAEVLALGQFVREAHDAAMEAMRDIVQGGFTTDKSLVASPAQNALNDAYGVEVEFVKRTRGSQSFGADFAIRARRNVRRAMIARINGTWPDANLLISRSDS